MPEPTVADLKVTRALVNRQAGHISEVTSDSFDDSTDMDAELRIIEPNLAQQEPEGASTDDAEEMTPQDLSVPRAQHTPSPITLTDSVSMKHNTESTPLSRKRKSTSPTQDRRAKWAFGESSDMAPLHEDMFMLPRINRNSEEKPVLSSEINERFLLTNSTALAMQAVALANEMCQQQQQQQQHHQRSHENEEASSILNGSVNEHVTPRIVPQAPSSPAQGPLQQRQNVQDNEDISELLAKITRAQEEFRTTVSEASGRFSSAVEDSVRATAAALQAKSLAALSVNTTPSLPGLGPPLPQLADVNGNPALFNLKDMSKSMEFMLASQSLPYRFMAAAAAANAANAANVANAANRIVQPLPYTPTSTLLQTSMPPAFPVATPISCSSLNGEGSIGDDSDGEITGDGSILNMSKNKKRTKVTDNHLRSAFGGLPGLDVVTATSVLNPTLDLFNSVAQSAASAAASVTSTNSLNATPTASLANSPLRGPSASFSDLSSSTLTPVHLRKAKLMFFYTRYPNSNVLKVYFPDVRFNKHNTAQIVKWFSNFREFYYIQIEKFARQAIAEGVQEADEIAIMPECELIRTLNIHYNRNNQIPVPLHFVNIVGITVREFFKALITQKDQDHSWKKPIYKVIARYDQPVPEEFKNSNWIDHLES